MNLHAQLLKVVSPPNSPVGNDGSWTDAEQRLQCRLPEDYKKFIYDYGCGQFEDSEIRIWNLCFVNPDIEYFSAMERISQIESNAKVLFSKNLLIPFGQGIQSTFFWKATAENPSEWSVVISCCGGNDCYDLGSHDTSQFLHALFVEKRESIWRDCWDEEPPCEQQFVKDAFFSRSIVNIPEEKRLQFIDNS